ncbi:MAG: hypothetical protein BWY44_00467 [Candidatus Omnitrophica bacterium ADurb.Bin292]|nr:MAG: hypothetical protein BWY44_00467 [Candidatus Omnitrophica bacterium ADurb.Bin292]HPW76520.1 hypothetical protein [Candidatus Omnitrophota bacterium]HQB12137.1 hypothetical protein [Candidatus Omnitrophota bacterium]
MNELNHFCSTILTQRTWSWAVFGIMNLLLFLMIRRIYFHPFIKRAKSLNSKWYQEIKKAYIRRSLGGWLLFVVSLLLTAFIWQTVDFKTFSIYEAGLVGLVILTLLLAVMSHISALGTAAVHVLKQFENNQMTL